MQVTSVTDKDIKKFSSFWQENMPKLTVLLITLGCASAFLILYFKYNYTSSQSPIGQNSSVEESIRDLMTLIAEEKRLRFQLEERLQTAENKINKMEQHNIRQIQNVSSHLDVIRELKDETSQLNRTLSETVMSKEWLMQIKNGTLKSVQGGSVGFSVNTPNTSADSDPLKFTNEEYNDHNAYNATSGMFVCKQPGLYYFTLFISSERSAYCYIIKNGYRRPYVYTYAVSVSYYAYASATNSILYQLHTGDKVYISGCNAQESMTAETSFTGFLVDPTN
ncbi:uncharacterized protein LOC123543097 [Mercenaria mercenaria]|uniref:uncharacterized protein LOC123543097 n=1 Tax=Mercenaria mercenaria TaxID=6596 RepID=UPI00234E52A7|nr:uncharacterized protein LOC123543097 [Mercenaria mercenaria]